MRLFLTTTVFLLSYLLLILAPMTTYSENNNLVSLLNDEDLTRLYSLERTPVLMGYPFIHDILSRTGQYWGQTTHLSVINKSRGVDQKSLRVMGGINYEINHTSTVGGAIGLTDYNASYDSTLSLLDSGKGLQMSVGAHFTKNNTFSKTSHAIEYSFSNQLLESERTNWNNDVHSISAASKIIFPWESETKNIYLHAGLQAAYRVSYISGFFDTTYAPQQLQFHPAYFDSYTLAASFETKYQFDSISVKTNAYTTHQSCLLKAGVRSNTPDSTTPEFTKTYQDVCSPFSIGTHLTLIPSFYDISSQISLMWKKSGDTHTFGVSMALAF